MSVTDALIMVLAAEGFILSWLFVFAYHRKSHGQWIHYPVRRHLVAFGLSMGVVFGVTLFDLVWGVNDWGWVIAMGLIVAVLVHRNALLFDSSWDKRPPDAPEHTLIQRRSRDDR